MRAAARVAGVCVSLVATIDCCVVCRALRGTVDCASVADQNNTLSYVVVRIAGATIHRVLKVQATASRVELN